MRSLAKSTTGQRRGSPLLSTPASDICPPLNLPSSAPVTSPPPSRLDRPAAAPVAPAGSALQLHESLLPSPAPGVADLIAENTNLKEKILHLKEELKNILDHSIESDIRLMQYTTEVFAASTYRGDNGTPPRAPAADCAVQCDLPITCRDKRCADARGLVESRKTTIEVLEAELQCLKADLKTRLCDGDQEWTVQHNKRKHLPLTGKRFQALSAPLENSCKQTTAPVPLPQCSRPSSKQKRKRITKTKSNPVTIAAKKLICFSSIHIEGDSHSRDLTNLVRGMVTRDTSVEGVCRPGAGHRSATSDGVLPPGSCCVIIASTNDIAAGQQINLYKHLEGRITTKLRTASVIVSTLFHRHDLPDSHPLHLETALANAHIEELCAKHRGAVVFDFNRIGRGAFTNHGMHLKPESKRLLAGQLLECLRRLSYAAAPSSITIQPPTPWPARKSLPPAACQSMVPAKQHEDYAVALKTPPPTNNVINNKKHCIF